RVSPGSPPSFRLILVPAASVCFNLSVSFYPGLHIFYVSTGLAVYNHFQNARMAGELPGILSSWKWFRTASEKYVPSKLHSHHLIVLFSDALIEPAFSRTLYSGLRRVIVLLMEPVVWSGCLSLVDYTDFLVGFSSDNRAVSALCSLTLLRLLCFFGTQTAPRLTVSVILRARQALEFKIRCCLLWSRGRLEGIHLLVQGICHVMQTNREIVVPSPFPPSAFCRISASSPIRNNTYASSFEFIGRSDICA
ncbi:hypothetical protein Hypma_013981, partial [Hypsizygus marmoreus]